MYSNKGINFFKTLTFRLTLWHLGVFSLLSISVFGATYLALSANFYDHIDAEMFHKVSEFNRLYEEHGLAAIQAEFTRESESMGIENVFYQLLSIQDELLAATELSQWNGIESILANMSPTRRDQLFIQTISLPKREHKIRLLSGPIATGYILTIGRSLKDEGIMLKKYQRTFVFGMIIMLGFGGIIGWYLAKKAMSGVQRVTETAARIGMRELNQRVPMTNEGREINNLVQAFNGMLDRIAMLLNELEQITDNVAHELRTPITHIRGMAETTLKNSNDLNEYREMAVSVIEGCDHLIAMVNTMLEITGTDAGVTKLDLELLDLCNIVEDAVDLFTPLAEDKRIVIHLCLPPHEVIVRSDRSKLQRVVANLLDNAIKYTTPQGKISLAVDEDSFGVRMIISDNGEGINETDLPHIFDRFYRGDVSRASIGTGLGLSLARAIMRAHNGNITVKSSPLGSTFTIFLPRKYES
ncbi:ATP-binding protein [Deltaproteobacteria bacterium TL4]